MGRSNVEIFAVHAGDGFTVRNRASPGAVRHEKRRMADLWRRPRQHALFAAGQINASNFYKLQIAWRFDTANLGPRPEYNLEATPLMVGGVGCTPWLARGAMWSHSMPPTAKCCGCTPKGRTSWSCRTTPALGRGLAYWTNGREERILYVTPGYRLIALDAKTGLTIPASAQMESSILSSTTIRKWI